MPGKLEGKTAVVTGSGRGIGRAIAKLFAREGARVVVNDLGGSMYGEGADRTPAEAVVNEIRQEGGVAIADYADVAEMDEAEALIGKAINEWGKLDILVNVAGIVRDRMVFNMSGEDWDAVMRVHAKGTFATTRFASSHWRASRQGGRLLNCTSVGGLFGVPAQPNYAAAKAAIWGFTLSCANALARYGVTANSFSPGAATRMTDTMQRGDGTGSTLALSEAAEGTLSDPANVAPALVYLASDDGAHVSGKCFGMSGHRIVMYSDIQPQIVLHGAGPWQDNLDLLWESFPAAFNSALPKPPSWPPPA